MKFIKNCIRDVGLWFFCKIGDPIFSPSQLLFYTEPVCLWCKKQHGNLTRKSAWEYILWSTGKTLKTLRSKHK